MSLHDGRPVEPITGSGAGSQGFVVLVTLVAEGVEMLEEDLDKERFFALTRRNYWDAQEGSSTRALMQSLIGKMDF